jgi:7-cyano-7-deazaguanine synthase
LIPVVWTAGMNPAARWGESELTGSVRGRMTLSSLACGTPVAVLLGGGIESTALVRQFLAAGATVVPVHVHCGLIWDDTESLFIERFLAANAGDLLRPLREIRLPLGGFLGQHWAVTGVGVPAAGAASADLEIPLRNLTLLGFALHRLHDLTPVTMALGTTADNCYRDGSRAYFDRCEELLSLEAGRPVQIVTPLITRSKTQVIRQSDAETLRHSFSCVHPNRNQHCGQCIKCGRRQGAFRAAGIDDPTVYADSIAR